LRRSRKNSPAPHGPAADHQRRIKLIGSVALLVEIHDVPSGDTVERVAVIEAAIALTVTAHASRSLDT